MTPADKQVLSCRRGLLVASPAPIKTNVAPSRSSHTDIVVLVRGSSGTLGIELLQNGCVFDVDGAGRGGVGGILW